MIAGRLASCLLLAAALLGTAPRVQAQLDALSALLGGAPPAGTSPFGEPPPPKVTGTPLGEGENTGFTLNASDRLELHARDLLVVEALGQLRQLVRRNIVVAPEIEGTYTGDLYDVSVTEAIEAICKSTDLEFTEDGTFIWIAPAAFEMRVYELLHSRSEDLVDMIKPLLTSGGSVSGTLASKVGIKSSQEDAGGDDFASHDVIVVNDFPSVHTAVEQIIKLVDAQPIQVLIEATILTAQMRDGFEAGIDIMALSGTDFAEVSGSSDTGSDVGIGPIGAAALDDGLGKLGTSLAQGVSNEGLNLGLVRGGVAAFVRAVESLTNTTVLANPKVLTVNKQRGEVLLGRRDGYQTSIVTQTSTTQKVEFLETGTRLVFRPFVLSDGYVRLEIHPEDSDGGINQDGLPFKNTAEVTSNIMMRDGQTVAIGGLFRDRTQTIHEQVPLLGDIPLLGWLFQSERDSVIREEIIVLVTPRVIDFSKDPAALTSGLGLPYDHQLAAGLEPWELPAGIDPALLTETYLIAGQTLIGEGRPGAAALLADVADYLGTDPAGVLALRKQAWAAWLPDTSSTVVDQRIGRMLTEDAVEDTDHTEGSH